MFDLAATLERYRHIVENADEIIFRADVSGNFTYVNPAAERLTGFAREELIGRSYLSLIDPEYRGAAEHFYHRQFRTRTRSSYFEFPMLARTGARIWLGQSVLTVFDADGRIEGYEAIARDITYRRGIEEELARTRDAALQSARAKAEFLANVSHEIRTPLNGVLGLTDLLLGTGLSPEQREYANGIRASAETLLSIVNDVLDLARVEAGKLAIEAVDFDLDDLLDSVSEQFATRFAEKGIRFRLAVDDDIPRALRGDSNRIRQVLLNLVGNALKFTERGEIVLTLRIAAHDGQNLGLRFVVTDTGIGIPTAVQGRLFRPFTQADGSTSRRFGGSGLGLAVCKRLVEAMSGEIGVMSVEGAGSTFWFEVPLVRQSDAEAARLRRWDLSRYRALLVDGNDVHRQMIARHLASARLPYDEATDAAEALAAVRARHYDVVVFDLVLPRDDGINLSRAIRNDPALEGIRLLLLTAFGRRQNDVLAYRAAGIDAFLLKPIRRTQLCDSLSRLLQHEGTAEAAVPVTPETAPALHARVLLVEDNAVNQTVARGQLHRLGHDSVIVSSGVEALQTLEHSPFDIILMDVQMPDLDGYEVTRRIRAMGGRAARTPIVAITAHAMPNEREKCLASGMNDYLAKPVSLTQLGAAIRLWANKDSTREPEPERDLLEADDVYVLDRERVSSFLAISGSQEGFLENLVTMFREDVPLRLDAMRSAAARGDASELAFAAHALKSSCGNVGAKRMHAVASALEDAARAGRLEGAAASIEQLAAEFRHALSAFDGMVRRHSRSQTPRHV